MMRAVTARIVAARNSAPYALHQEDRAATRATAVLAFASFSALREPAFVGSSYPVPHQREKLERDSNL